jgi:hypothetical protein
MVVIARPEHRTAFRTELKSQGFDVDAAISRGQFNEYDAEETLNKFMDGQLPNRERFSLVIGQVIDECRKGHEDLPVLAYGEMVDILWRNDKCEAAILLEELWNELAEERGFKLFCAYALNGFYKEAHHTHFERICKTHSRVYPTEKWLDLSEEQRLVRFSMLEQEALALRAEIQHRKENEKAHSKHSMKRERRKKTSAKRNLSFVGSCRTPLRVFTGLI